MPIKILLILIMTNFGRSSTLNFKLDVFFFYYTLWDIVRTSKTAGIPIYAVEWEWTFRSDGVYSWIL